jgi:hypothetical protein
VDGVDDGEGVSEAQQFGGGDRGVGVEGFDPDEPRPCDVEERPRPLGVADLRDVVAARSEPGELLRRRGIERGELPAALPIETVVDSWLGFILYHFLLMQREPTSTELTDLVNLPPFTPPTPRAGPRAVVTRPRSRSRRRWSGRSRRGETHGQ